MKTELSQNCSVVEKDEKVDVFFKMAEVQLKAAYKKYLTLVSGADPENNLTGFQLTHI